MRVISGRFKGVALTTPKAGTRPTTDRTKEAIFSHLDSWGVLDDARVLDLFAGTGALGIEALSRGARELVAVESSAPAAALIAQTLTALKHNRSWEHGMSARVVKARAEKYAASASAVEPFDMVFIDGDKREYPAYYRMLMGDDGGRRLVHGGSVLIADNILWSGKVVQPIAHHDRHTQALVEFNRMVVEDPRVENVIVPLRDGLNLIRIK